MRTTRRPEILSEVKEYERRMEDGVSERTGVSETSGEVMIMRLGLCKGRVVPSLNVLSL
jgi:hypothetical protein